MRSPTHLVTMALVAGLLASVGPLNAAPAYEIVHPFELGPQRPAGRIHVAADGSIYGMTSSGGKHASGTAYRLHPDGRVTTLVHFPNVSPSGTFGSGLVLGPNGAFYGTTPEGGSHDFGTLFRIDANGTSTTLIEFTGVSGSHPGRSPQTPPVFDGAGNLYGTTQSGGASNLGTLYKVTPEGAHTVLANFTGSSGDAPGSSPHQLMFHSNGKLYGVTLGSGTGSSGTIFTSSLSGEIITIINFTGNDGDFPGQGPLSLNEAPEGTIYGLTSSGGAADKGTIFKLTTANQFQSLVAFTGTPEGVPGAFPAGSLAFGADGFIYGTTSRTDGNLSSPGGTVFKMSPAGQLTTLAQLQNSAAAPFGSFPSSGLVLANDGCFYGATSRGGFGGDFGTILKITPTGEVVTRLSFRAGVPLGNDRTAGVGPIAGLVEGPDGSLYGTTGSGGLREAGTVFKMKKSGGVSYLAEFSGSIGGTIGNRPEGPLHITADGTIYGTTLGTTPFLKPTLFRISPSGEFTTLVDFLATGGTLPPAFPRGTLVRDGTGNLFGVCSNGGLGGGVIYKVSSEGSFSILHSFSSGVSGRTPTSGLLTAADGNYYGSTRAGGSTLESEGSLFRMTPAGAVTFLADFPNTNEMPTGDQPEGPLHIDPLGNVYGTASNGGSLGGGTVFRWSAAAGLNVLAHFDSSLAASPKRPKFGVVFGQDGALYGVTDRGGTNDKGAVYRVGTGGSLTTLFSFSGLAGDVPGETPQGQLLLASDGNLYGVMAEGGPLGGGGVYRLRFGATAETLPATNIQPRRATLNANVHPNGETTMVSFEYGTTLSLSRETETVSVPAGNTTTSVSIPVSRLNPGRTHFFRVKATNASGTERGEILSFDTNGVPPLIVLNSPLDNSNLALPGTLAFAAGAVDEDGTVERVEFLLDGVKVGEDHTPPFAFNLVNPPPGDYQVSAVAYDDDGRSTESDTRTVHVLIVPPTVSTFPAADIALDTATLRGQALSYPVPASVHFEWGLTSAYDQTTPAQPLSSAVTPSQFTASLTTLLRGTEYHYRAVAVNSEGTSFGVDQVFTTLPNHPPDTVEDAALLPAAGATIVIPVLDNDSDSEGDAISLTAIAIPPQFGTAEISGNNIVYVAGPSFSDADSLNYEVTDSYGDKSVSTVQIFGFRHFKGTYTAAVETIQGPVGAVNLRLSNNGGFTGTLGHEGYRWTLKGKLDSEGKFLVTLQQSARVLTLQFALRLDGVLEGQVEREGADPSAFSAPQSLPGNPFGKKRQRFTSRILPVEAGADFGSGWAAVSVDPSGRVSMKGRLADATPFSASTPIRNDRVAGFHTRLYGTARGFIAGEIQLDQLNASDSILGWFRPAQVYAGADAVYRRLANTSFHYLPPRPTAFPLTLGTNREVRLTFSQKDFPEDVALAGLVTASGEVRFNQSPQTAAFKYRRGNGTFSGSTKFPSNSGPSRLTGAFFQGSEIGGGVFGKGNASGSVVIEAAAQTAIGATNNR